MTSIEQLKLIPIFAVYKSQLNQLILPTSEALLLDEERKKALDSALLMLLSFPVSKLSKFLDEEWDFNEDAIAPARNVTGAKLRINFSRSHIPEPIVIELKVLLILVKSSYVNFSLRKLKNVKINSILPAFKRGLDFLETTFRVLSDSLGREYVHSKFRSVPDLSAAHFASAAAVFDQTYSSDLKQFFSYLNNPFAQEQVFKSSFFNFDPESVQWLAAREVEKRTKLKIIPDAIFEKLVFNSSIIVIDFLKALSVPVKDLNVEKFASLFSGVLADDLGLDAELWRLYRSHRLYNKGYSNEYIDALNDGHKFNNSNLRYVIEDAIKPGYKTNDLRLYVNKVSYACSFLISQFSGMRPSELQEIIVKEESCLLLHDGQWLLTSKVKKTTKEGDLGGLFDERWVAIPIVRDAVAAAAIIAEMKANPYLMSNVDTVNNGATAKNMTSTGITHQLSAFVDIICPGAFDEIGMFNPYLTRHTLAYQLYRMDLGLPLISFQLKHFVTDVEKFIGRNSAVTLGYGDIGDRLAISGRGGVDKTIRKTAEIEAIKGVMDPDGIYYGNRGVEHKARLKRIFKGYMEAGYTKDEIFEAMADQGLALINVGQGFCYGGRTEDFDDSLPCIGSLRCNPVRCSNAIVTKLNIPKWREVYHSNKELLQKPEFESSWPQIRAAMEEALMVLEHLEAEI